jgi:uncharacterized repeat protein (TIGR03803 family)
LSTNYTNFARLFSFGGTNGATPSASLIEGTDGRLYGITTDGGLTNETFPQGLGLVFSLNKNGSDYKVLHYFRDDGVDGQKPGGALVEGRFGALYGTTSLGGHAGKGTIFKLNKNGHGYYILHHFQGGTKDGANPSGGLLRVAELPLKFQKIVSGAFARYSLAIAASLYGPASAEGPKGNGTIFRINETGKSYRTISTLVAPSGWAAAAPSRTLAQDKDGVLFGVAAAGFDPAGPFSAGKGGSIYEGSLFRFQKAGAGLSIDAADFVARSDILGFAGPVGPLLPASDGFLYGVAWNGPSSPYFGCIFRCSARGAWDVKVVHGFGVKNSTLGSSPAAGVVEGPDGYLYGTSSFTYNDFLTQDFGAGTVFKVSKNGSQFSTLKIFSGTDGASPGTKPLLASDGALYGTTNEGGDAGHGTIFVLYPGTR